MISPLKHLFHYTAARYRLKSELHKLWRLAWPILVGQLAYVGMAVVDVAMAGHASAQDLAGVSLGVSIWNMLIITMMGLLMAVNPVVAHQVGSGDLSQVPHVVRQALWKALAVGLLSAAAANLAARLFQHMTLEPYVRDLATDFVWITSLSMPLFACYRVLYGYSTSINQTKPLMVIALLSLGLNIVVNSLLVFGTLGFPRLGGLGCAWATLVTVAFNLLALLWWMRRASMRHRTGRRSKAYSNWAYPSALLTLQKPVPSA